MTWAEPEVVASKAEVVAAQPEVVRELEEECEELNAELQRVVRENKHLKATIQKLETQPETGSQEDVVVTSQKHSRNDEKIEELEQEVRHLQQQLSERDESNVAAADDSWRDSDADDSASHAVTSRADLERQVAVLRSQLLDLSQRNEQLLKDNNNSLKQVNGLNGSDDVTRENDEFEQYKRHVTKELEKLHEVLNSKKVTVVNGHLSSPKTGAWSWCTKEEGFIPILFKHNIM